MRKLFMLLFTLLWPIGAMAAPDCTLNPEQCRCVGMVFVDTSLECYPNCARNPDGTYDDLSYVIVPWSAVQKFERNNDKPVGSIAVFYDQPDTSNPPNRKQGGPTLTSGQAEYALSFVPGANGDEDELIFPIYNPAGGGTGEEGLRSRFLAGTGTGDITLTADPAAPTGLKRSYVSGAAVGGFIGETNSAVYDRADDLFISGPARAEVVANGCP